MSAMKLDPGTPEGRLGRALKKLMDDLYDHPQLIGESTTESLSEALRKLERIGAGAQNTELQSEAMLKDLLASL